MVTYVSISINGLKCRSNCGRVITSRVSRLDNGTTMIVVRMMRGRRGRLVIRLGRNLTGLVRYGVRRLSGGSYT